MGQSASAQQVDTKKISNLTNEQIAYNVNKMFTMSNTIDTVHMGTKYDAPPSATSSINIDTLVDEMKGGNTSRVSVFPKRCRYNINLNESLVGGDNANGALENNIEPNQKTVEFVRNMINNNSSVNESASINNSAGVVLNNNTAVETTLNQTPRNPVLQTIGEAPGDLAEGVVDTAVDFVKDVGKTAIDVGTGLVQTVKDVTTSKDETANTKEIVKEAPKDAVSGLVKTGESTVKNVVKTVSDLATNIVDTVKNVVTPTANDDAQSGGHSLQNNINAIRNILNNSISKQDGGLNEQLISDDDLKNIKANLSKHGIVDQSGGSMDNELEQYKNSLLNNNTLQNMYSATSSDPVNFDKTIQTGGAHDDDDDDDDVDDDDNDARNVVKNKKKSNNNDRNVVKTNKKKDDDEEDDEDEDDDDEDDEDDDTTTDDDLNEEEHGKLDKLMDKKNNKYKFLNNYKVTSNSERDYKIDGKPLYSSQSSEFQSSHGSEYLNNLRNRDRLK